MNSEQLLTHIGEINPEYIQDAEHSTRSSRKKQATTRRIIRFISFAACLAITVAVAVVFVNSGSDYDLSRSDGFTVRNIKNPPNLYGAASLVPLTEEELFAERYDGITIDVVEGTVTEAENIVISYGGIIDTIREGTGPHVFKDYRSIVTIEVSEVYRSDIEIGESVTVLLHSPVAVTGNEPFSTDSDISSRMTVGAKGIFLLWKYDESTYSEQNGNRIYLLDLAQYGVGDGERCGFIDTPEGPVFSRHAFESIADATTMDEVRQYVITMLEN